VSDRQQFTVVASAYSGLAKITCGVPQGSVLGPFLFLLYVNDVATAVPNHSIKLFADDTNLFVASKSLNLLHSTANEAIKCLNVWFIVNTLSLILDITCYKVFLQHKGGSDVNFDLQLKRHWN
jgi:Reverse transcriptase (RNA-dependent DNA polymerase)